MKVCIIQPAYSTDFQKSDYYFEQQLRLIEQCDESMDLIVLPESCDIPCLAGCREESVASSSRFNSTILKLASDTAKRY
jgi:predicted amidohydrolase